MPDTGGMIVERNTTWFLPMHITKCSDVLLNQSIYDIAPFNVCFRCGKV